MGVTPNLVIGTWVGGEDRWIRFRSFRYGQGARMARPFVNEYLRKLEDDPEINFDETAQFSKPSGELNIETDCEKYNRQMQSDDDPFQNFDQFAEPPEEDPNAEFGGE